MKKAFILIMSVVAAVTFSNTAPDTATGISDIMNYQTVYAEPDDSTSGSASGDIQSNTAPQKKAVSSSETSDEDLAKKVSLKAGETTTFPLKISTGAKNGSIKIVHSNDVKFEILSPSGLPSSDQNVQHDSTATIINLISPAMGEWKINMTSETDQEVSIVPHINYEIKIVLKTTSNFVEAGEDKRYIAEITGEDANVDLSHLKVKLRIKGSAGTETKDMLYINGSYECTYKGSEPEKKTMTALVEYKNDTIESEPIDIVILKSSEEKSKSSIIIPIILICIPLIALLAIFLRFRKKIQAALEIRPLVGSLGVKVIKNNIAEPEEIFPIDDYGKSQSLYNIVQKRALLELQEVMISGLETGIKVINKGGSRVRFSHVSSNPEGVLVRYGQAFKVFMSDNRTEVYVRYIEPEIDEAEAAEEEYTEKPSIIERIPFIAKIASKFKKETYALPEKESKPVYYTNASAIAAKRADNSEDAVREVENTEKKDIPPINLTKNEEPADSAANSENSPLNFIPVNGEEEQQEKTENEPFFINLDKQESSDAAESEETVNPFAFIPLDETEADKTNEADEESAEDNKDNQFDFISLDKPESEEETAEGDVISLGKPEENNAFEFISLDKQDNENTENSENSAVDFIPLSEPVSVEEDGKETAEDNADNDVLSLLNTDKSDTDKNEESEKDSNPFAFLNIDEPSEDKKEEIPEISFDIEENNGADPFAFLNIDEPSEDKKEETPEISFDTEENNGADPFAFLNIDEPAAAKEEQNDVSDNDDNNPFSFINLDDIEFKDDVSSNIKDIDVPEFMGDSDDKEEQEDPFKHISNDILDDIPVTFLTDMTMNNDEDDK